MNSNILMKKILISFLLLAAIYISLSFIGKPGANALETAGYAWEDYDPGLLHLQSVEDIIEFTDSECASVDRNDLEYVEFLASAIRKRFYHAYSRYGPRDNWIAWASGKLVWDDLDAIVIPDDILKHPNAACSQQAIVLGACFKKIGIPYREIDLQGHFVLEGKIGGKWYYFDPNLEPRFVKKRRSLQELIEKNELFPSYANSKFDGDLQKVFSSINYKPENAPIALKAKIFHRVTEFLSLVLLLLIPASGYVVYTRWKQSKV